MSDRWLFIVTWDPEAGPLPMPILRLFAGRPSTAITVGQCTLETDEGHATHYVRAVKDYLSKRRGGAGDIVAIAQEAQ
jgi:hypothetical protein